MKKTIKIMGLFLFIIILSNTVAYGWGAGDINGNKKINMGNLFDFGNLVMGIVKVVGIFSSVGILTVLGIKYMWGSPEEKSDYKKSLMPYLVGSIMLFGASELVDIIYKFIKSL